MNRLQDKYESLSNTQKQTVRFGVYSLAAVGGYVVSKALLNTAGSLYRNTLRFEYDMYQRYGDLSASSPSERKSWVAVTGSTGSIGFSYCKSFAKRGFNILMIARNPSKIARFTQELKTLYPDTCVLSLQCDFADLSDPAKMEAFTENLDNLISQKKLDIAMLINVAGVDVVASRFTDNALSKNMQCMVVNMFPCVVLTQTLMKHFARRQQRSCMLNLGAHAGKLHCPKLTIYGATKAFMNYFSVCTSKEFENSKMDIICINPLGVSSNMVQSEPDGVMMISSDQCAEASIKHIGKDRESSGWWFHGFQSYVFETFFSEEMHLWFWNSVLGPKMVEHVGSKKTAVVKG